MSNNLKPFDFENVFSENIALKYNKYLIITKRNSGKTTAIIKGIVKLWNGEKWFYRNWKEKTQSCLLFQYEKLVTNFIHSFNREKENNLFPDNWIINKNQKAITTQNGEIICYIRAIKSSGDAKNAIPADRVGVIFFDECIKTKNQNHVKINEFDDSLANLILTMGRKNEIILICTGNPVQWNDYIPNMLGLYNYNFDYSLNPFAVDRCYPITKRIVDLNNPNINTDWLCLITDAEWKYSNQNENITDGIIMRSVFDNGRFPQQDNIYQIKINEFKIKTYICIFKLNQQRYLYLQTTDDKFVIMHEYEKIKNLTIIGLDIMSYVSEIDTNYFDNIKIANTMLERLKYKQLFFNGYDVENEFIFFFQQHYYINKDKNAVII